VQVGELVQNRLRWIVLAKLFQDALKILRCLHPVTIS
jgi:hypothetical protein